MSVALVSRLKIYYLKYGSKFKFLCMLFDIYVIFISNMHGFGYISNLQSDVWGKRLVCSVLYINQCYRNILEVF